jgi:DNA polymerase zeta
MSVDPRHSQPPGWIHEEECREQLQHVIEEENATTATELTFSNYIKPVPFEDRVKTTLQSVEDLYPQNLLPALGLEGKFLPVNPEDVASSIQVDEK